MQKNTTHKKFLELHTWIGITLGLLIYVVSFSGCAALFDTELHLWEDINTRVAIHPEKNVYPITPLLNDFIDENQSSNRRVTRTVLVYPQNYTPYYFASLTVLNEDKTQSSISRKWHPYTGEEIEDRGDGLSDWLSGFHREFMLPAQLGQAIIGVIGLLLMMSLVSGVIIHRNILKNMFSWRFNRSRIANWRDAHNSLAVWGLPFYIVVGFTGTFLGLVSLLVPIVAITAFKGDQGKLESLFFGEPSTEALEQLQYPLEKAKRAVEQHTGKQAAFAIIKDAQHYEVSFIEDEKLFRVGHAEMNGITGEIEDIHTIEPDNAVGTIFASMAPLHYGTFGGFGLKVLYFCLGIMLCITSLTGVNLWITRMMRKSPPSKHYKYTLFQQFSSGISMGMIVATIGIFYADRLIPSPPDERTGVIGSFYFLSWGAWAFYAVCNENTQKVLAQGFYLCAYALLLLPIVDAITSGQTLIGQYMSGLTHAANINLILIVSGLMLLGIGRYIKPQTNLQTAIPTD